MALLSWAIVDMVLALNVFSKALVIEVKIG